MPPRAVRRSSRSSARPSSRPSGRPACLPRMPHGPHHLICSPLALPCSSHPFPTGLAACLIRSSLSSPHRLALLIGSSCLLALSAHRFAPCLVSPGSPFYPTSETGRGENAILIGGLSLSADSERRAVSWLLACPGAAMWAGRLCRFFSSHRLTNRLRFPAHPIIQSTGRGLLFLFARPPSRLLFSTCLPTLVPPSPAGGGAGCGMACDGGRAGCLLAFLVPRSALSPCGSFARCYMPCAARAVRSCLGCCGAFYGLFCPLSCRRWRFSKHALKWHPVASDGHFRRCCPLLFLGSPRCLALAPLPLFPAFSRRRCHGVWRACFRW